MLQGLYSSVIDNSLQSLWTWMLKFREEIYSIAVHVSKNYYAISYILFVTMFLNTHFCSGKWWNEFASSQVCRRSNFTLHT